ncbi:hypothetical protein J8273_3624 [Carpediemonas membranifera]|uniref:Uncharacterized protein n=1 Tax=Carpediemonas membranifera TaxID=201153 RepID=A0A8J6B815_9EUKA|nr:hypothetical protein J8273_3624 [Carpediemonas membranifera]|eukprot:KAG9394652.1 hypothetical protein J8273_3624 [Carpediemonas membranifera]
MVTLDVDYSFPTFNSGKLSPSGITRFRDEVRILLARHPAYPVATLFSQDLQDEITDTLDRKLEDISADDVNDFLRTQVVPVSLNELRKKLKGLPFNKEGSHQGNVRAYSQSFKEYYDLRCECAKRENVPYLRPVYGKVMPKPG